MKEIVPELTIFKSNRFMFYVTITTVIFLSPYCFYVIFSFSKFAAVYKEIHAAGVALIIASAIMLLMARKNVKAAQIFAALEIIVALYYYIAVCKIWDWALIPAIGFSCILPYSISVYAKEMEKDNKIPEDPVIKEDLKIFLDDNPTKTPADYFKNRQ